MSIRALIADDEPRARRLLRELLAPVPWISEVYEAGDGQTALDMIRSLGPDMVFMDVAMPNLSGTMVASRAPRIPFLVFTTAYDSHAVTAFELEAFDYLLKPFGERRLQRVLARVERALSGQREHAAATPNGVDRLSARVGNETMLIPVRRVERLQGWDDFVAIYCDGRRLLGAMRLRDCARQLDPKRFVRVHRSHIVNLDYVAGFTTFDGDRVLVRMTSGVEITASRAGSRLLRRIARETPGALPARR